MYEHVPRHPPHTQELADHTSPTAAPDGDLPVPDHRGSLLPARDLVYDDAPWLTGDRPPMATVHPRLSHEVAERVGVSSLRRQMLSATADGLQLDWAEGGVEAFGQREALTTRIRHVLGVLNGVDDSGSRGNRCLHRWPGGADGAAAKRRRCRRHAGRFLLGRNHLPVKQHPW